MRTADVCPTCATYTNALCVIYAGPLLTTLDINPQDDLETILAKIEDFALNGTPGSSIITQDEGVIVDATAGVLNFVGAGVTASDAGSSVTTITIPGEVNDLTASVIWSDVPNANITLSSIQQHQSNLVFTESQISDLQAYLKLDQTTPETVSNGAPIFSGGIESTQVLFDTTITPEASPVAGLVEWNDVEKTLDVHLGNDVTLQVGQEVTPLVRNQTGSTITNGTPVRFAGSIGASGRVSVAPAIADGSIPSSYILGLATEDISNGNDGHVTWFGKVRSIDTTGTPYGETWADGDLLYVSPTTAGYLTNVKPSAPNLQIFVGAVVNANVQGTIFVRTSWRSLLTDLDDVNGTPLTTNGQIMVWDNDNSYFDFSSNISDFALSSHSHVVADITDFTPYTASLTPVEHTYADSTAMIADQGNQTSNYFQYTDNTDTYYEYLGTTGGVIGDYREVTDGDEITIIRGSRTYTPVHIVYASEAVMFVSQKFQRKGYIYRTSDTDTHYEYLGTKTVSLADYKVIGGGAQSWQDIHDGTDGTNNFANNAWIESPDGNTYFDITAANTGSYLDYQSDNTGSYANLTTVLGTLITANNGSTGMFAQRTYAAEGQKRYSDFLMNIDDIYFKTVNPNNTSRGGGFEIIGDTSGGGERVRLYTFKQAGQENRLDVAYPHASSTTIHRVITPAPNVSSLTERYMTLGISDGSTTLYANSDGVTDISSLSLGGATPNLQAVTDVGSVTTNNIDALSFNGVYLDDSLNGSLRVTGTDISSTSTGTFSTAFGHNALQNSTGGSNVAVGTQALQNNSTFISNTAIGYRAGESMTNSSNLVTLVGEYAYQNGDGVGSSVAIGATAGRYGGGTNNVLVGTAAGQYRVGSSGVIIGSSAGSQAQNNNIILIGSNSGIYNQSIDNIIIGTSAYSTFTDDVGNAKNVANATTDVDISNDRITITAHGFGSTGQEVNLRYSTTGTNIGGLSDNSVYAVTIIDANTIEFIGINIFSNGTDTHTFTPMANDYSNVVVIGRGAEPTKSNQVLLGNSSTTEVKTSGAYISGGFTVATLPTGVVGMRAYVTDSTVAASGNFGATVAGGGANTVPVFYDGTNWIIA